MSSKLAQFKKPIAPSVSEQRKITDAFTEMLTSPSRQLMIKFLEDPEYAKEMVKLDSERMLKMYEILDVIRLNRYHLKDKDVSEKLRTLYSERTELLNQMLKYDKEHKPTGESNDLIEQQYRNIEQEEGFYIDKLLRNYNTEVKLPIQFVEDSTINNAVQQLRFEDAKGDADRKIDLNLKVRYRPMLEKYANEVPAYKNRIMAGYLEWRQAKEAVKEQMHLEGMERSNKLNPSELEKRIKQQVLEMYQRLIKQKTVESYDYLFEDEIIQLNKLKEQLKEVDRKSNAGDSSVPYNEMVEARKTQSILRDKIKELEKEFNQKKETAKKEEIDEVQRLMQAYNERPVVYKDNDTIQAEKHQAAAAERREKFEAAGGRSRSESPPKTREYIEREEKIAFYKSQIDKNKRVIDELMKNPGANNILYRKSKGTRSTKSNR
jgi:phage gp36-like protein